MSTNSLDKALASCRSAAIRTLWRQWSILGGQAGGRFVVPRAVIDPEGLLLLSCVLRDHEPRLWDLAAGFAANSCSLLSVQRTRNVGASFPESVKPLLAEIASIAVEQGKDSRWKPLSAARHRAFRGGKISEVSSRVAEPAALIIRLRLAFGVHARTDALAFLIASAPAAATAREIAEATCYGEMPVRRAMAAMSRSRIIVGDSERPERYHAEQSRWGSLLHYASGPPTWVHWQLIFAFLADALSIHDQDEKQSDYLLSSRVRKLVLKHWGAFIRNRISVQAPEDYPGSEYLRGFTATLNSVATWLESNT
jgi:hypothetical protein